MPEPTFVFDDGEGVLFAVLPDAVPRVDHAIASRATEQESERGVATTDHVREERDRFSAEIVISDSPIRTIEGDPEHVSFGVSGEQRPLSLTARDGPIVNRLAALESAGGPQGGARARGVELGSGPTIIPSSVNVFRPNEERTVDNWTVLRSAKAGAWLAVITTDLHVYRDMLLVSAEVTRTATEARWIRVEVIFVEFRQAATELVDAAEPLRPRDERQANDGSQATDEEDEELVSGLSQMRDALPASLRF